MKKKETLKPLGTESKSVRGKPAGSPGVELSDDALGDVVGGIGLDYTKNKLTTSSENVQSAETTYRDADMSKEMPTFSKEDILRQTQGSMEAQANNVSQGVLTLLQ